MVRNNYQCTEIGWIPDVWHITKLGNVADVYRGGSPRPIQNYITKMPSGTNWIKIGDVKVGDKYIIKTEEKIIPSGVSHSRRVYVGDFILSNSMSYGRPYILKIDGCIHDGWLTIQNFTTVFDVDYFYYLLSSHLTMNQYISMAAGSSVKNLNKEKVSSLIVPVPPYEEQQAIAGALSDVDKLITNLEKLIVKKKAIKQGAMQELLTGRKRISGFCKKWKKEKLSKFASTASGGTPSRSNSTFYNGDIRWVTTSELNDCRIQDTNEHITLEAIRCSSAKIFPAGTLLMAMYGATIGKLGIIEQDSATNQACCAIMPNSEVLVSYLYYWLLLHRKEIVELGCGAGQPNISQQIVKNLIITYPEVSEQQCIVNVLMDIDVELKKLDKTLIKYRQIKQGMMQKLLTGDIRLV